MIEIEEIFNEFKLKLSELEKARGNSKLCGSCYFDEHMNAVNPTMMLYKIMLEKQGFMNVPQIISNEEYSKIQSQVYYHGFKEKEHAKT